MNYKKAIAIVISLCLICALTFVVAKKENVNTASLGLNARPQIIIDAGHGGFDGGAVAGDGTEEKELNLEIALKVNEFCKAFGYETLLVRNTDTAINNTGNSIRTKKVSDMKNRAELMKKYPEAIYVSIHMNKYSDNKPQGAQIFYSHKTEASKTLALCVQTSIKEYLQQGNKREVKPGNKDIYLLENATVPTVIVECGFLSNETDLSLLKDDEYQSKLAFAISVGIKNYSAD